MVKIRLRTWSDEADAAFALPVGEVHVWQAVCSLEGPASREFDRLLSPEEWARAARLLSPGRRLQFRHSRGLLRLLLGRYLNIAPDKLRLVSNAHGKPLLDTRHSLPIHFSLSHTQALVVFAFGIGSALGIDVEAVVDLPDCDALAALAFTSQEIREFETLPKKDRAQAFLRRWTAKEACLKALGRGLSLDPRQVELQALTGAVGLARVQEDDQDMPSEWPFQTFEPAPGFVASLAWESAKTAHRLPP